MKLGRIMGCSKGHILLGEDVQIPAPLAVNVREIDVGKFAGANPHGGFEFVVARAAAVGHEKQRLGSRQLVRSHEKQIIGAAGEIAEPKGNARIGSRGRFPHSK